MRAEAGRFPVATAGMCACGELLVDDEEDEEDDDDKEDDDEAAMVADGGGGACCCAARGGALAASMLPGSCMMFGRKERGICGAGGLFVFIPVMVPIGGSSTGTGRGGSSW